MSFIQGNINSKEDLIEAMDAMREMLTQGDPKTELELELAETKHKLAGIKGEVIGGDYYMYYEILRELEINLESRIQKLEEADKGPQETGYDDFDDDDEPTQSVTEYEAKKFLESFLENTYGLHKPTEPQEIEEEEPAELTSEEYLEEILEKINSRTQANIAKLHNNPWGL